MDAKRLPLNLLDALRASRRARSYARGWRNSLHTYGNDRAKSLTSANFAARQANLLSKISHTGKDQARRYVDMREPAAQAPGQGEAERQQPLADRPRWTSTYFTLLLLRDLGLDPTSEEARSAVVRDDVM